MANQRMHLICGNCGNIEASTMGEEMKQFKVSLNWEQDNNGDSYVGLTFTCVNCATIHFFHERSSEGCE